MLTTDFQQTAKVFPILILLTCIKQNLSKVKPQKFSHYDKTK